MFLYVFENEYAHVSAEALIGAPVVRLPVSGASGSGVLSARVELGSLTAYRPIRQINAIKDGSLEFEVNYAVAPLRAPIAAGDVVGTAVYSLSGRVWYAAPLVAEHDLPAPTAAPSPTPVATAVPAPPVAAPALVMPVLASGLVLLLLGCAAWLLLRRK